VAGTLSHRGRQLRVRPRAKTTVEPDEPAPRAVLDRYVDAFERADAAALESLLRPDAALEMIGVRTWFAGKRTCAPNLERHVLGEPGEYRMFSTSANGQPTAIAYRRSASTARYEPFAVAVLDTDQAQVTSIIVFADVALFPLFG
jgi:RNA polymerase sigma-70 factor (ECF subfamily)